MLSLRIALRYLFSRKSHSAVNIISFISLAGVAVATVAVVCVLSVFNGFTDLAGSRMSMIDPQLEVKRVDAQVIADGDSLVDAIKRVDGVEMALPTLMGQALAVYHDKQMPVRVKGVPGGYDRMTGISSLVIDGEFYDADASPLDTLPGMEPRPLAAMGVGVAVNMLSGAGITEPMGIYVPRRLGNINPANPLGAFTADSVVVTAVFQVDQPQYDADLVMLPLETVRYLLDYEKECSSVEVKLAPDANEGRAQAAIAAALGPDYMVLTRMEQQADTFRMIRIEKWISFLLLAFILVIASFNIISTLSILIIEKESNIRTMIALGASRGMLSRIFMLEGWLISIGGGIVGIIVGVALCLVQQYCGIIKLAGDTANLAIDVYPVRVDPVDLLAVLALVALIGLMSTALTRRFVKARVK